MVTLLLDHGADINAVEQTDLMDTPMHYAVKFGKTENIRVLIKRGANLQLKSKAGDTALHVAVQFDQISAAELLLNHGLKLDPNMLPYAAMQGKLAMVKWLIEHGADPNTKGPYGVTALSVAISKNLPEIADYLTVHGAKE
jgi:ankyrin repeat protein